jgi:hypothetical protein
MLLLQLQHECPGIVGGDSVAPESCGFDEEEVCFACCYVAATNYSMAASAEQHKLIYRWLVVEL